MKITLRSAGVVAAAMAAGAGARADIYDYHWSYTDTAGGSGTYNRTEMHIFGGNAGVEGVTAFTAAAPVSALIMFDYEYSCPDGGTWDYCYYQINGGPRQVIVDNAHQGTGVKAFSVAAGDTFTLGVYTADGAAGAGFFRVIFGDFGTLVAKGVMDFPWHFYESPGTGNGTGYVAPPYTIHVDGSTNSPPQIDEIYTSVESPVIFYLAGSWSCDGDDEAYWATGAKGQQVFGNVNNQGSWALNNPGITKNAGDWFGLGVRTNGAGQRGVLDNNDFFSWVYTHQIEDVPWQTYDDAGGSVDYSHIGERYITIKGGNANKAGTTETYDWEAGTHYLVQATMIYSSPDGGTFDYAYYSVNGKKTIVADNDSQGAHPVEFRINAGDSWAFGVGTVDGMFGAGTLVLDDYRAFPAPPVEHCYPDFTGDGVLNLFDFLSYVNYFNAGEPIADCDDSGNLDLFDFLCFTNAFNAGC